VAQVVGDVFAIQAQDAAAASLGIWARSDGLSLAEVVRAREDERSIVRVWSVRGTLHLLATQDVRWVLDLLRPVHANLNRARRAQLGLDEQTTARGVRKLEEMLASDGPLARAEIADRLARHGIPSQGQATIHIIWRAALDGLVCCGPDRKSEETFVLLHDWLGPAPAHTRERAAALRDLAQRFLHAYGPATPEDLATWSGLPLSEARSAFAALGAPVREAHTPGGRMWFRAPRRRDTRHSGATGASALDSATRERAASEATQASGAAGVSRLLPAYDSIWLGYRDRGFLLPAEHTRRVFPGGGLIRPSVLVDGRVVGTWTRATRGGAVEVTVDTWGPSRGIDDLVTDLARFVGRPARLAGS
jgi:hypothetical protein